MIAKVEAALPGFVALLVEHRPKSLRGKTLRKAMQTEARQPARLTALFKEWVQAPAKMYRESPALAFAVLGQAKMDNLLNPEDEADLLAKLLNYWAMRSTLDMSGVLHELTYDAGTSVY